MRSLIYANLQPPNLSLNNTINFERDLRHFSRKPELKEKNYKNRQSNPLKPKKQMKKDSIAAPRVDASKDQSAFMAILKIKHISFLRIKSLPV